MYAGTNGLKAWTDEVLLAVIAKLFALLSTKRCDCEVSSCVPVTAVRGVVLGVKLLVYTAVPLIKRRFDTYPVQ